MGPAQARQEGSRVDEIGLGESDHRPAEVLELALAPDVGAPLRPVGAVPGPVTSVTSAGPHELIKRGAAEIVTDAADVTALLAPRLDLVRPVDREAPGRQLDTPTPGATPPGGPGL